MEEYKISLIHFFSSSILSNICFTNIFLVLEINMNIILGYIIKMCLVIY